MGFPGRAVAVFSVSSSDENEAMRLQCKSPLPPPILSLCNLIVIFLLPFQVLIKSDTDRKDCAGVPRFQTKRKAPARCICFYPVTADNRDAQAISKIWQRIRKLWMPLPLFKP